MPSREGEPLKVHGDIAEPRRMSRAELARRHIEDPGAIDPSDASWRAVLIFLGGLLASLALILLGLWWVWGVYSDFRAPAHPSPLIKASQVPPEPRLQPAPQMDLKAYQARQDALLNSYGWVNRNAGIVRIPVARAMELLAQRGLPARTGTGPVPTAPDTGAASGGPQTGPPAPRGKVPPGAEKSAPLRGLPESLAVK